jgi:hypothetical protein
MNTTTRTCPDVGAWRAWLDHEDHPPSMAEHLQECPGCRRLVDDLRDDAASVGQTLSALAPSGLPSAAEIAVARERLEIGRRPAAAAQPPTRSLEPIPMLAARVSTPWRIAASGLAAALVVSLVIAFTPEGGAAAASFLAQFRSQQVTAVEVTPQSQAEIYRTLNALGNLGTIKTPGSDGKEARPEAVARGAAEQARTVSLAEAGQVVGFTLKTPDPATLPAGFDTTPRVRVMPAYQMRFTFDRNKARAYFQSTGHPEINLPEKFDGATLVVSMPAAALLDYQNGSSKDALILGQAGELVVDVEGGNVTLPEMRDFLLSMPGLPPLVVAQLKQIQNWNETLPIPVPVDQVHWQSTTINGNQGLLLNDNSNVGSAAIWHAGGHLYGLAGSMKASDLVRVANSLH